MIKRVILIVLDSVGIGQLPDAVDYGDDGSDTIGNIWRTRGHLYIPNMLSLGLGNIDDVNIREKTENPIGCFGKAAERSKGKDTTTGHWEICGIVLDKPFPVYPHGFPEDVIRAFEEAIGRPILGNIAASGTEIIKQLGQKHMQTGYPIVYTSADSVFQIAAHEDIIPVDQLYDMCLKARGILTGQHGVARVIARPFIGQPGNFQRTERRRDFSLKPPAPTLLDKLVSCGYSVAAVGKIEDIFAQQGITDKRHTTNNDDGIKATLDYMGQDFAGLIFTNLVDFDMLYGHRNDVEGYAKALEDFDAAIPALITSMKDDDMLIITADHGCDPTTPSTDHSREYIPILLYGRQIRSNVNIGVRSTYADIGATITDILKAGSLDNGRSFKNDIM